MSGTFKYPHFLDLIPASNKTLVSEQNLLNTRFLNSSHCASLTSSFLSTLDHHTILYTSIFASCFTHFTTIIIITTSLSDALFLLHFIFIYLFDGDAQLDFLSFSNLFPSPFQ